MSADFLFVRSLVRRRMEGDRVRDVGFEFGEVCYWRWGGMGQEECECGEGEVVRVRMGLVVVLGCRHAR